MSSAGLPLIRWPSLSQGPEKFGRVPLHLTSGKDYGAPRFKTLGFSNRGTVRWGLGQEMLAQLPPQSSCPCGEVCRAPGPPAQAFLHGRQRVDMDVLQASDG